MAEEREELDIDYDDYAYDCLMDAHSCREYADSYGYCTCAEQSSLARQRIMTNTVMIPLRL